VFIPMWVVWLVVGVLALPVVGACAWFFTLAIVLGKEAERNAGKRREESLAVLACPACRPLLPGDKCEEHRWHTTPPPSWLTAEALEVWDCPDCGPIMEKVPCARHRRQAKPLWRWVSTPPPPEWLKTP
jgi:hypothetical protein